MRQHRTLLAITITVGLALELWLWSRSVWIYWDQAALYTRALEWLEEGSLAGLGKLMSGGFQGPAGLLQIVIGAPLGAWHDVRSASLVVVLFHVAALAVLLPTMARLTGWRVATCFALVFWLAPRRLYLGAFVWEPSYLFLPAALHLWATAKQREIGLAWPSFVLGLALASAPQLHPSGIVLAIATVLLLLVGSVRLRLSIVASGALVGSLPAVPWLVQLVTGPPSSVSWSESIWSEAIWAEATWRPISGLVKAATYWIRLPSPDIGRRLTETTLCGPSGPSLSAGDAACNLLWVVVLCAQALALFCLLGNLWYLRRGKDGEQAATHRWLRSYVGCSFGALLLGAMLSPNSLQGWYTVVVLHAACVPVALWISENLARLRLRSWFGLALSAFLALRIVVVLILGFSHPMFVEPEEPAVLRDMLPEHLRSLTPGDP